MPKKIIFILIATNLMSLIYIFYNRPLEGVFNRPYPLIDVARNFIPQEDFIVNIQPLRKELNELVQEVGPNNISLYFEFLNTGANIQINPNLAIWPASLPKVPAAMAVMRKVERGEWGLKSELVLSEQDRDTDYGSLWEKPIGTKFTVDELLREMLVYSDNTAYRIFIRNLDFEDLFAVVDEVGISELFTNEGFISAKEYSRLFRALYISSFLKRENSEKLLKLLDQAEFDGFLSQGIPEDRVFSHKFGIDRDNEAYLDSGIVYADGRPYILSVVISGRGVGDEEKVRGIMRDISSRVYQYVMK